MNINCLCSRKVMGGEGGGRGGGRGGRREGGGRGRGGREQDTKSDF